MADTIITGCMLVDAPNERRVWGDLWEEGDCYIFNAVLRHNQGAGAAWEFIPWAEDGQKAVRIDLRARIFERRGVIVFQKDHASLNQVASDYLTKGSHGTPS
jgi:hypothetical protein